MSLISHLVEITPQLKRGEVWCRECGANQKVDSEKCIKEGWLKCCGYTMTIDSPTNPLTNQR